MGQCLREFRTAYNENTWGCVGPMLLTDILNRSSELKVARPVAFYKVHWSKQKQMFRDPMTEAEFHDPEVTATTFGAKCGDPRQRYNHKALLIMPSSLVVPTLVTRNVYTNTSLAVAPMAVLQKFRTTW